MFARILSSAAAGLTITAGLLYLMHYLIDISEGAVDPGPPLILNPWGTTIDDTEVIISDKIPDRIAPPIDLPVADPLTDPDDTYTGVRFRAAVERPTTRLRTQSDFGYTDGALINIITVRPQYPAAAASRGLGGHVVVKFDVTVMGTVTNVSVIESSSSLFHRSAIEAVKKFRFKPKVFDGVPQESFGVQRLFTFEMEKN